MAVTGGRVSVDVYVGGVKQGAGPIFELQSLSVTDRLDRGGEFTASIPASDPRASLITQGAEVRFSRETEGEIFRGLVSTKSWDVHDDAPVLVFSGDDLKAELLYANTLIGRTLDNVTVTSAMTTLLSGTGWTLGAVDGGLKNVSARFDGVPKWGAILKIANTLGYHVRESSARTLACGAFGAASGIALISAAAAGDAAYANLKVGAIKKIAVVEQGANIVNVVIPLGSGEGNNQFAMGDTSNNVVKIWSTRSVAAGDPYNITTGLGPNGNRYYQIADATSRTAYGDRAKVLVDKSLQPIANSPTAAQNAANALYDLAATYLQRFKDPLTTYTVDVTELPPASFLVGDTVRLVYNGVAEDGTNSRRAWLAVDADVVILEKTRTFAADGSYAWKLTIATAARWMQDDQQMIIGALETLDVFRTGVQFYTTNISHGSERESIDSTHSFDYSVVFDANVSRLLKTTLQLKFKQLKSNVTAAGAELTTHTHDVNLSTHTHGINTAVSATNDKQNFAVSAHIHKTFSYITATPSGYGGRVYHRDVNNQNISTLDDTAHSDFYSYATDSAGYAPGANGDHTHNLVANTSGGGSESAKTTINTTGSHTHPLTYGIFTASTPTAFVSLSVYINGTDRSAALGGPFNSGTVQTLDISQYLVDANGHPLRQDNIVQLRTASATAYDVIAHATSLLAASAIEAA